MNNSGVRYVGSPDFHDGFVRAVSVRDGQARITVEGDTGKMYLVTFGGVAKIESSTSEDMMLYALSEAESGTESLKRYEFINWYIDEPDEPESKSFLRVFAASFTVSPLSSS